MTVIPERLFYNCDSPLEILQTGMIRCSKISTGVSMSSWSELKSHGPFKIEFKQAEWFHQFLRCHYPQTVTERERLYEEITTILNARKIDLQHLGRVVHAGDMFLTEHEWYSPEPVYFAEQDIASITFMTNAPNIHPRIAKRTRQALQKMKFNYTERCVSDPYPL